MINQIPNENRILKLGLYFILSLGLFFCPSLSADTSNKEKSSSVEEAQERNDGLARNKKKVDPVTLATLSLIPGYSGLYQLGDYSGGALFSVLELMTVGVALRVYQSQSRLQDSSILPIASYNKINLSIPFGLVFGLLALDSYNSYWEAKKWNSDTYELDRNSLNQTNPLSRLWRSALLPGWGQYFAGEKRKGR